MIVEYIALLLTFYVAFLLWNQYRPKNRKRYFKKMCQDLEYQIWDKEFERFKTKEAREELRVEYDRQKAQLSTLETQMKLVDEGKTPMEEGERKRLDDKKVLLERDVKRMAEGREEGDPQEDGLNLKNFDRTISIHNAQVDQLHSLQGMVKEYIKKAV